MARLVVKEGREKRARAGHPWIYSSEIARVEGEPADWDQIDIIDSLGNFLGRGYYNPHSMIAARILSAQPEPLDGDFFRRRLIAAIDFRKVIVGESDAYRLVFSEGDLLPGLIVDRYADCLVVQFLTQGMERRRPMILELLADLLEPRGIYERSDVKVREYEGLPAAKGVLAGEVPIPLTVREGRALMVVDVQAGQKTGLFLDQRENRLAVARLLEGKEVLDCFSYTGGFAIQAALAGARRAIGVEISEAAIDLARKNAELNGASGTCEFRVGNAFDFLKSCHHDGVKFDAVILDPPAFTKSRESLAGALRGYKEINLRAMKILRPGGFLITSSCSHHLSAEDFQEVIHEAAKDCRVRLRVLERRTQSRDHPILFAVRETEYLKCLVLQAL